MQLEQLPDSVRESLRSPASDEARAQAMAEYGQRFVTHRLDASCLNAASSGQSSTVNAALTGGDPFQVIYCSAVRASAAQGPCLGRARFTSDSAKRSTSFTNLLGLVLHRTFPSGRSPDATQAGGLLRDWQARPHLAKLAQPMLLLEGSSEELLPQSTAKLQALRPGGTCTVETLEGAASYAHINAWEPYLEAVNTFLNANDQQVV